MSVADANSITLPQYDYTQIGRSGIETALINYIKTQEPVHWTDFYTSNLGYLLVKLYAYLGDMLMFYNQMQSQECYLSTAKQRQNVINLCRLIGYSLDNATAASVTLSVDPQASYSTIVISEGTQIDVGDVTFEVSDDYSLSVIEGTSPGGGDTTTINLQTSHLQEDDYYNNYVIRIVSGTGSGQSRRISDYSGSLGSNNIVTVSPALTTPVGSGATYELIPPIVATEGESYTENLTGDGTDFQEYTLNEYPVIDGSITVIINSVTWTKVDFLALGDPDDSENQLIYQVTFDEDDKATIEFGDDSTGQKPLNGDSIVVSYRKGGGTEGNIAVEAIANNISATCDGEVKSVYVWNGVEGSGGADKETIDHAKLYAPQYIRTVDKAITKDDYKTLSSNFSSSTYGRIYRAGVVCDPSDGISNQVMVYPWALSSDNDPGLCSTGLKSALTTYLDDRRICTTELFVLDGTEVPVYMHIRIRVSSAYDSDTVKTNVQDAIGDMFLEYDALYTGVMYLSKVYDTIAGVEGVVWSHIDIFGPALATGTGHGGIDGNKGYYFYVNEAYGSGLYTDQYVLITSGTGVDQLRYIGEHGFLAVPVSLTAHYFWIDPGWITTPPVNSGYAVLPQITGSIKGTAASGTSTTITLSSYEPSKTGFYANRVIRIVSGTGSGQQRTITSYTNTRIATVDEAWTTTPDNTSIYLILMDISVGEDQALTKGKISVEVVS